MTIKARSDAKTRALDAALKAAFDVKAAESTPQHLVDLVDQLDAPVVLPKAS